MEKECLDGTCPKPKNIAQRMKAPTPKLFKRIRNISLALSGAGAALLGLPFDLSPLQNHLAEWCMIGGVIAGMVSQAVTTEASE